MSDLILSVIDVGQRLPVFHNLQKVLLVLALPMVQSASDELLLVVILDGPGLPYLESTSSALVVGPGEAV